MSNEAFSRILDHERLERRRSLWIGSVIAATFLVVGIGVMVVVM